ncbi:MAG TPA: hypothetical protein VMK42_07935 [Anaeromyxobacteraceae bacterium]|nr:hypothetical protein [Anaeromyxobacteraceae bacterium]
MPNVVDLTLTAEARRSLHRVLDQRGIGFFLKRPRRGPAKLDPRRIAWVVAAAAKRTRGRQADPDALSRTRRVIRRDLIRRLAESLVDAGL